MLAFSNDYYGFIFRATQSVELFCAYYSCNIIERLCHFFSLFVCIYSKYIDYYSFNYQIKKMETANTNSYNFHLSNIFFYKFYFLLPTFSFFKILEVFTSASIKVKPVRITATPIINNVHALPLSNVTKIAIIATGIFIYPKLVAH